MGGQSDYVHLNPARAGLVGARQKLSDYSWHIRCLPRIPFRTIVSCTHSNSFALKVLLGFPAERI
jgi:hypothetical protein